MIPEYKKMYRRIDEILQLGQKMTDSDLLKQSIAAHVCVLQSGLLEKLIKETITAYSFTRSPPDIHRFVSKRISTLQNPSPEKIESTVNELSGDLKSQLEAFWNDNGIRDHVSSIVSNRHLIAHGQNYQVSISRVTDWHKSIGRLISFLEGKFQTSK